MIACMGGWCSQHREKCEHYRPGISLALKPVIIERLCEQSKIDFFKRVASSQANQKEPA